MANNSIINAMDEMWQQTLARLNNKSDKDHIHNYAPYVHKHMSADITTSDIVLDNIAAGTLGDILTIIDSTLSQKAESDHTHKYAGSSSAGGAATSANKINTDAGSATQPVYFANGIPVKTTYTLGASVPSGAKFTDTVYTHPTTSGNKHIPSGGSSGQILRWSADGTAAWGAEKDTTYNNATSSTSGLMSADDKAKLDGIATNANNYTYTHPTHTAYTSGLYKVTVNNLGHVTAATAVAKSDITGLGIPAQDTTYSNMTAATSSAAGKAGLVPAPGAGKQASFLRGDGTWVVPTNTTYSAGTGISLSGTTFSNSGVRAIATGSTNGTIKVNTNGTEAEVAVKGLGSAAYTASTAYAPATHTHDNLASTTYVDNAIASAMTVDTSFAV